MTLTTRTDDPQISCEIGEPRCDGSVCAVPSATVSDTTTTPLIEATALESIGRALAHTTRRRILLALVDGPSYPGLLAQRLDLGKANTSNHLSCLRGCGLVVAEPEGRNVRYEIADERITAGLRLLAAATVVADPDCAHS